LTCAALLGWCMCVCVVQVTDKLTAADVTGPPEDGIYVDGLWLEGARWDAEAGCLAESQPGVMSAPLPIVHFKPAINYTQPADEYQCPLYKTSARAGVLSTTGCSTNFVLCVSLPCPAGKDVDAWVLQGVALLCQLDS
jgi:dynein heavy chain